MRLFRRRRFEPAMPGVDVSIKRHHSWEAPVRTSLTFATNGTIHNPDAITFGPFTDTERPQHVTEMRAAMPNGAVVFGFLFFPLQVPPGGRIQFAPGTLTITLT